MSVLSIIFLYICYELLLKLEQHLLFRILCFKLIELLGNFYYGNWMIDFSFNYCVGGSLLLGIYGSRLLLFLILREKNGRA